MDIPRWRRRYLTLDRYMAGDLRRLLFWIFLFSILLFGLVWLIGWWISDWSMITAFINLTNPITTDAGGPWEWVAIVIANLVGLAIIEGIILTFLINWVSSRRKRHLDGEARYDYIFSRPYAVILGGDRLVASLARDLIENGENEFVLVQSQSNAEELRKNIRSKITDGRKAQNVIIYSGSRTSLHELRELHPESAREIFIIGEADSVEGPDHDALNMECWQILSSGFTSASPERVNCHVMFQNLDSFKAFQFTDIQAPSSRSCFRFMPFGFYENWARQLMADRDGASPSPYLPLDGPQGISFDTPQRVHLIICGMSPMARAIALEAAHLAHYPNFTNHLLGNPRTLITFIDPDARHGMLELMGMYGSLFSLARWRFVKAPQEVLPGSDSPSIYDTLPDTDWRRNEAFPWTDPQTDAVSRSPYFGGYLGKPFIDIDFEFIEGDVFLPSVRRYLEDSCGEDSITTLALAPSESSQALSMAFSLPDMAYEKMQQIWVYQKESGALVDAVSSGRTGRDSARFARLMPFGMTDSCDYVSRAGDMRPRLVAYIYECVRHGLDPEKALAGFADSEELRKALSRQWFSLSDEGGKSETAMRRSNTYCADSWGSKLRSRKRALAEGQQLSEDIEAEVEHNRWIMEQLLTGMRPVDSSYAGRLPVKDPEERTALKSRNVHPDLLAASLLGSGRIYDLAIIRALDFHP